MDDDDFGTQISMQIGDVSITVTASAGWTPEMIEDTMNRVRRQTVAAARQLGLVADVEDEADMDAGV